MGSKSEFETILDQVLNRSSAGSFETAEQMTFVEDFFSVLKFKVGALGTKAYPPHKAHIKKENIIAKEEPKVEPIRVKRKLTYDQEKALKVLAGFGVKLDEYSTQGEIRSAYRNLALKYHPDRNKEGAEAFKTISMAYKKSL
jgi:hypothetical protein